MTNPAYPPGPVRITAGHHPHPAGHHGWGGRRSTFQSFPWSAAARRRAAMTARTARPRARHRPR